MNGASMGFGPAVTGGGFATELAGVGGSVLRLASVRNFSGGSATLNPSGASCASFKPSQNEPNESHGTPSSSTMKLGSIAFQFVRPGIDSITLPWSTHL